ncbi:unnamed protein product, partial [Iphiclides podalirius]
MLEQFDNGTFDVQVCLFGRIINIGDTERYPMIARRWVITPQLKLHRTHAIIKRVYLLIIIAIVRSYVRGGVMAQLPGEAPPPPTPILPPPPPPPQASRLLRVAS